MIIDYSMRLYRAFKTKTSLENIISLCLVQKTLTWKILITNDKFKFQFYRGSFIQLHYIVRCSAKKVKLFCNFS